MTWGFGGVAETFAGSGPGGNDQGQDLRETRELMLAMVTMVRRGAARITRPLTSVPAAADPEPGHAGRPDQIAQDSVITAEDRPGRGVTRKMTTSRVSSIAKLD
ncbi:hypothetical protein SAV14893_090860 [Streptomyces avermitilis]|uniref:Uncharacterized protein n=1 Tax=Streptomyces avermitilis TaxID=33903 RepID=A0A4D4N7X9_STRAX|nr:hypothetical protein SAVMC3_05700 [Streptomyces avermitilis]GDY69693.1 hypothetical protein SAV14893_090860 [Streptomyces avermitilis]GDY79946.1 hypothetical protein SAV31267_094310 [Streptomyces avermitilis]